MSKPPFRMNASGTGPELPPFDFAKHVKASNNGPKPLQLHTGPQQPPFDISKTGNHLNLGKTFPNIVHNGPHHVDGHAYGKIPLTSQTPPGVGGGLQYRHDFGHSASVNVDHVNRLGTTVQAQANARLFQSNDRSAQMDLGVGASKHFGPLGPSATQGQGMLSFKKQF